MERWEGAQDKRRLTSVTGRVEINLEVRSREKEENLRPSLATLGPPPPPSGAWSPFTVPHPLVGPAALAFTRNHNP